MGQFKEHDVLSCSDCGKNVIRKSQAQRYCSDCSSARDRKRKKHSRKPRGREETQTVRENRREFGREKSIQNRTPFAWVLDEPNYARFLRVRVPFDKRFSKNAIWSSSSRGHVYMRNEVKAVRDDLIASIQNQGEGWFDGKIWIDIFVEKPNHRFDAVNVIDMVCDAVKKAINIDDNWFCIRRVDWSIVKDNPTILVGIGQEVEEHHRCCSNCGMILPLTEFGNNKYDPYHGKTRTCRDCNQAKRGRKEAC